MLTRQRTWTTPTPYAEHDPGHAESPAVAEIVQGFLDAGLLRKRSEASQYGSLYEATDAMRVWVEGLCNVPWPEQRWVLPNVAKCPLCHAIEGSDK